MEEPKKSYKEREWYCRLQSTQRKTRAERDRFKVAAEVYKHLMECNLDHTNQTNGREKCHFFNQ